MFYFLSFLVFLNIFGTCLTESQSSDGESDFDGNLIDSLRVDANLDLSEDEEYEDLRSELLAYHTALASLVNNTRRSLMTAPCANAGGICINYKLCPGYRHLTEIPGCKNRQNVCCFVWNLYVVRDHKEYGLPNIRYPWRNLHAEMGGKGIVEKTTTKRKRKRKENLRNKPAAVIVLAKK